MRSKIVKLNKNVEEKKISTSVIENEEKHSRLLEKKNEKNRKSYANLFYCHCFYCTKFGHKVADCRDYKRNVQARSAYVAARNIECYKFHNYGNIASDYRSMIDTSMKENTDIRYKKVWIRKQEEQ